MRTFREQLIIQGTFREHLIVLGNIQGTFDNQRKLIILVNIWATNYIE
jgi:hypothetical protein